MPKTAKWTPGCAPPSRLRGLHHLSCACYFVEAVNRRINFATTAGRGWLGVEIPGIAIARSSSDSA